MEFKKDIRFTPGELKLITLLCKEFSTIEIGAIMRLKPKTIENYKRKIQKKIGARNEVGIAVYALYSGMLIKK
jgi:DNA-binding CsgD family transcriptional regulator